MTKIIWNSVGLTIPDDWEPSALERDSFMLENRGLPRCELKWNPVRGSFSFDKHMKRLSKTHKDVEIKSVAENEAPEQWRSATQSLAQSGIRLHSFMWKTSQHKGVGAALHNPGTGLAALIQFFVHADTDENAIAKILTTFRDYSGGTTLPWAMFGLSARVPADFRLDTFSFKPGHYTIKYWRPKTARQGDKLPAGKGAGTALTFERFAPASVILKGTNMAQWVLDGPEAPPPENLISHKDNSIVWSGVSKSSLMRRVLRREIYSKGLVREENAGNALLLVRAEGTVPLQDALFEAISTSYELV